jgi:hypothetical protein
VELLQLTYLQRTQPTALAIEILNPIQLQVLRLFGTCYAKLLNKMPV